MAVDWEERVDFERLRTRAPRARQAAARRVGARRAALLRHEQHPLHHRHPHRHVGDGQARRASACCPQDDEPILWDFGSAARHHQLYCPWLDGRALARRASRRCAARSRPRSGRAEDVARKIRVELEERGLLDEPLGVDVVELPVLFALQAEGITVVDGQQLMQQARMIKTAGRDHAAQHRLHDGRRGLRRALRALQPGHARERVRRRSSTRCSTTSARSTSRASTRSRASAAARTRTSSPTACCGRATRPTSTSCTPTYGYRTCYYRTFAVGSASQAQVDAYKRCRDYPRRARSR